MNVHVAHSLPARRVIDLAPWSIVNSRQRVESY
jgi:hypothetical protein